jgi:hypothetical protein
MGAHRSEELLRVRPLVVGGRPWRAALASVSDNEGCSRRGNRRVRRSLYPLLMQSLEPEFGITARTTDSGAAVRQAIDSGARTWREVSAQAGISPEWARQLGLRMNIRPSRPKRQGRRRAAWNAPEVQARFWSFVDQNGPYAFGFGPPSRCWVWRGPVTYQGYGRLYVCRFRATAHGYSYRLHYGRKPWSVLDHVCHSYSRDCRGGQFCIHRRCVNPDHLEVVSPGENARRSSGSRVYGSARQKVFPSCSRGHRWSIDDALYDSNGRRVCVWCVTGAEPSDLTTDN